MGPDGKPGASLRAWRDFFPNAEIFGADIDRGILFQEDRIKTYYCDQGSPNDIKTLWDTPELQEEFDIIIEDGLHEVEHNVIFFENSIHKLKVGGVYIIEDLYVPHDYVWYNILSEWKHKYSNINFRFYSIPHSFNKTDNGIVVAQRIS
jgi:hypothetical protein